MKRSVLSLVLALLMVLSVMPVTASASAVPAETGTAGADVAATAANSTISDVTIAGGAAPVAGGTPNYSWIEPTVYMKQYSLVSNVWHNLTDGTVMLKSSTFASTKTYAVELVLKAGEGYAFDRADKIEVGFSNLITATSYVVFNDDADGNQIRVFFIFRMSGDTDSCIVRLLPNGGTGYMKPVIVKKNRSYTLPSCSFTAPYGGYFKQWSVGAPGDTMNISKDIVIEPEWGSVFVDEVGVTGIASPCWMTTPDYTADTVGAGYQINRDYDDNLYIIGGVEWREYNHTRVPFNRGISNGGTQYYVTVYLKSNTLRWFNDISEMTATVNGIKAKVEQDDRASDPDSRKYIKITYGFPSQVNAVQVRVDEPAAYQKPSYTPTIYGSEAKRNSSKNTGGFTGGVYWLDLNTRKIMQQGEVFLPGHAYRFVIDVIPQNMYEFPIDFQQKVFLPYVAVNENKIGKNGDGYGDFTAEGVRAEYEAWVGYDFPAIPLSSGSTVSGSITSYLDGAGEVTVELLSGEEVAYSTTVTGNTVDYSIADVADGSYTLRVSKKNHVARDYDVTVAGDTQQDVKICPIGDVNNDGEIKLNDYALANAHARNKNLITDPYRIACGDTVSNDGEIKLADAARINAHYRNKKSLWS